MTDAGTEAAVFQAASQPTTYYQPQYEPVSDPSTRGMPVNSRGSRGTLQASSMLDLGALAAASGMTRSQVTGFLEDCQEAALAAVLSSAPKLLQRNKIVAQSRLNEIGVKVDRLRRITIAQQQTGWRGLVGMAPTQPLAVNPEYVSLAEVQAIINEMIATLNAID